MVDFLSKLLKFFFGLFLSGLVLSFAVIPALENLAEADPPPDPALAAALAVAGPLVVFYVLGFLWSLMGEMLWDMLPSLLKYVFGAFTLVGLAVQLLVIASTTFLVMSLAGGSAGEGSQGLALLGGAALLLFLIMAWLMPFIFWLGYMWFPINLLTRSKPEGSGESERESAPGPASTRIQRILDEYGAPPPSSQASTGAPQPGQGLLDRALKARPSSQKRTEGPD